MLCIIRGDERRRLLRTGRVASRMRRLCAMLYQRGHRVRTAGLGRALHPVQVHQNPRPEGNVFITAVDKYENYRLHSTTIYFFHFTPRQFHSFFVSKYFGRAMTAIFSGLSESQT